MQKLHFSEGQKPRLQFGQSYYVNNFRQSTSYSFQQQNFMKFGG